MSMLFSIIIPSRGTRPKALNQAINSIWKSLRHAADQLDPHDVEILVGFDGVRGERVTTANNLRYHDLPQDQNWGNGIRDILLRQAKGEKVVFLDDDNSLTPNAFVTYLQHMEADMLIARIDTSRALDKPFLPVAVPGKSLIRQGNIDPLCLCLSRDLVQVRCQGWRPDGGYEADFVNILRYWRRARCVHETEEIVGIYDAGQGLDNDGLNFRQKRLAQTGRKSKAGW